MTPATKKSIDLITPTVLTAIVAYIIFSKTKNWKFILIGAGITFLLGYIITTQLTKVALSQGPAPVPTGGGCTSYDPTALIDSIYQDCTCILCFRNADLYSQLLALSDCQLITAYNYWNSQYYSTAGNISLPIEIAKQGGWDSTVGDFATSQPALALRFSTLNLQ